MRNETKSFVIRTVYRCKFIEVNNVPLRSGGFLLNRIWPKFFHHISIVVCVAAERRAYVLYVAVALPCMAYVRVVLVSEQKVGRKKTPDHNT